MFKKTHTAKLERFQINYMKNKFKVQYRNSKNLDARIRLHRLYGTNKIKWWRWVFDHFDLPKSAKILELGCGQGNMWLENKDRIPEDWNIILSDFSEGMLEDAKKNLSKSNHTFNFVAIDAQTIPYPDQSFDCVIANHMLYHVSDRRKTLSEIKRVLKPKGCLYATTVSKKHMRERKILEKRFDVVSNSIFGSGNFTLENGRRQLAKFFRNIRIYEYKNELKVTNAEHLMEYILSMARPVSPEKISKLRNFAEKEISKKGFILITNHQGIFVAQRKP
jgi:ubiquinone/menaquinone biosynthesis C-methylase UbiE